MADEMIARALRMPRQSFFSARRRCVGQHNSDRDGGLPVSKRSWLHDEHATASRRQRLSLAGDAMMHVRAA